MKRDKLIAILDYIACHIACAIVWALAILPRRNLFANDTRKHILIIANDRVGDILIRLPFYAALRKAFPKEKWHITATLPNYMSKTLSALPYFDEILETPIQWDNHGLRWIFKRKQFISSPLRWAFWHKIDILISPVRFRALGCDFVHQLSRPRFSVAYSSEEDWNAFPMSVRHQRQVYDHKYTCLIKPTAARHQLDDLEKMLYKTILFGKEYGHAHVTCCKLSLTPQDEWKSIVDAGYATRNKLHHHVVFVPGASSEIRQWPAKSFAGLAEQLEGRIVVVGSANEHLLGERIISLSKSEVLNLCGKTTIAQLGAVLLNAKLVVTNETGTATYAAVLGVPTICILGGGDFGAFFPNPYYQNTVSVFRKDNCYFCGWKCKHGNANGLITAPCIQAVSVDDVLAAIGRLSDCRSFSLATDKTLVKPTADAERP